MYNSYTDSVQQKIWEELDNEGYQIITWDEEEIVWFNPTIDDIKHYHYFDELDAGVSYWACLPPKNKFNA